VSEFILKTMGSQILVLFDPYVYDNVVIVCGGPWSGFTFSVTQNRSKH